MTDEKIEVFRERVQPRLRDYLKASHVELSEDEITTVCPICGDLAGLMKDDTWLCMHCDRRGDLLDYVLCSHPRMSPVEAVRHIQRTLGERITELGAVNANELMDMEFQSTGWLIEKLLGNFLTAHPGVSFVIIDTLQRTGRTMKEKDPKTGKISTRQEPLSAKTVKNIHGILSKALSIAVDVGYIKNNPAERVTLPRVEKTQIVPLTDQQVKAFMAACTGHDFERVFKLILFTGLREGEALGLTWDCVDFDAGTLKITKQLQKRPERDGGYTFAPLKNDKARTITAAPFVMQLLREHYRAQTAQRLQAGEVWQGWQSAKERETGLVFTRDNGRNLDVTMVYKAYKKLAEQTGAPDSRVHDLRHTYAVLSLQNGDPIKTAQDNLGHTTAAFTLDVYGHVSEKMKEDSAARMQAYIENLA